MWHSVRACNPVRSNAEIAARVLLRHKWESKSVLDESSAAFFADCPLFMSPLPCSASGDKLRRKEAIDTNSLLLLPESERVNFASAASDLRSPQFHPPQGLPMLKISKTSLNFHPNGHAHSLTLSFTLQLRYHFVLLPGGPRYLAHKVEKCTFLLFYY